jgi:hypothetical protein
VALGGIARPVVRMSGAVGHGSSSRLGFVIGGRRGVARKV